MHPQTYLDTYGRWAILGGALAQSLDGFRAFVNTNTLGTRASAYWSLIDPSYLFFTSARSTAPLLMVSAPLIVAGIVRCVRLAPNTAAVVVLAGLLVAPLAGASFGEPHYIALRAGPAAVCRAARGLRHRGDSRAHCRPAAARSEERRVKAREPSSDGHGGRFAPSVLLQRLAARRMLPGKSSIAPGGASAGGLSMKYDVRSIMSIRPSAIA